MSITARCRCGKKYQVKSDAVGKKFKCKECGRSVTIPDEVLDDLEDVDDYADDSYEEEVAPPVRKKKRRRSSGVGFQFGDGKILRVIGLVIGLIGYVSSVCYFLAALGYFVMMLLILTASHGPDVVPLMLVRVVIMVVAGIATWFGARAACGHGTDGDVKDWNALARIITGIVVIFLPGLWQTFLYLQPYL